MENTYQGVGAEGKKRDNIATNAKQTHIPEESLKTLSLYYFGVRVKQNRRAQ